MKEKKRKPSAGDKKEAMKINENKELDKFIDRVFKEDDNLLRRLAQ